LHRGPLESIVAQIVGQVLNNLSFDNLANDQCKERYKNMPSLRFSKRTTIAMPIALACALAAVTSKASAAHNNDREDERGCSNQTLHGDYGLTIEGLLNIPGNGIEVRGVVLQSYDGNGHITQLDHVVIGGNVPPEAWRPGSGTYTVNADCTGKATITIPSSPAPPLVVYFVVVQHGNEIHQVVEGNAAIATGKRVR
jgi:hypothetical protein